MDVLVLIDRLDDLVHNAKAVPLTDQVRVDREEVYEILDQMRATIPEEIKQARWIVKERQEMLAEHGLAGRAFTGVQANTVSAFALGDWEWILAASGRADHDDPRLPLIG